MLYDTQDRKLSPHSRPELPFKATSSSFVPVDSTPPPSLQCAETLLVRAVFCTLHISLFVGVFI